MFAVPTLWVAFLRYGSVALGSRNSVTVVPAPFSETFLSTTTRASYYRRFFGTKLIESEEFASITATCKMS